jgi:CheY-like chemotaxis protein
VHGLEKAGVEMDKTIKIVLMADDDEDDTFLVRRAFAESGNPIEFRSVPNGEELLDYLFRRGKYKDPCLFPDPNLVLLDLNMPGKGGYEALAEIKADPTAENIPIVVYTTSNNETDIRRCYELGANSYVVKPDSFHALVDVLNTTAKHWLETMENVCHDPFLRQENKSSEHPKQEVLQFDKQGD